MGSDHDNYLGGELEEKREVQMDSFSLLTDKQMNLNPTIAVT